MSGEELEYRPDRRDMFPSAIRALGYALRESLQIDEWASWFENCLPKNLRSEREGSL